MLRLRDRITAGDVRFVITGLYRPRQVSSPYWGLDQIAPSGSSTAGGFTTYGPFAVPSAAFAVPSAASAGGSAAFAGALTVSQGTWLAAPQTASIPASQLTTVAANVTSLREALASAQQLPALTLTTSLPAVLDGTASDLDVARSLLAICAVLLFLLAGATLLAVARLLAGQREGESAMLAARGAARWQLVTATAAEAVPLCVLASALGGVAGLPAGPAAGVRDRAGVWDRAVFRERAGRPARGWRRGRSPPGRRRSCWSRR